MQPAQKLKPRQLCTRGNPEQLNFENYRPSWTG